MFKFGSGKQREFKNEHIENIYSTIDEYGSSPW